MMLTLNTCDNEELKFKDDRRAVGILQPLRKKHKEHALWRWVDTSATTACLQDGNKMRVTYKVHAKIATHRQQKTRHDH